MLKIDIESLSKYGNPTGMHYWIINKKIPTQIPINPENLILDISVRDACILQRRLSQLDSIIKIKTLTEPADEYTDVTQQYLHDLIRALERCLGKTKYTQKREKPQKAAIEHLKANGVVFQKS